MIPIGNTYLSTIGGTVWRAVRCTYCQCDFAYKVPIIATAREVSPLFLSNKEAAESASENAQRSFERKARTVTKPVRCPDCQRLQPNMVKQLRTARLTPIASLILVPLIAAITISPQFKDAITIQLELPHVIVGLALLGVTAYTYRQFVWLISGIGLWLVMAIVLGPSAFPLLMAICLVIIGLFLFRTLSYDPNSESELAKTEAPSFKVIRRAEFEALAAQLTPEQRAEINFPTWPS
jgi:hypothetical protein